MKIEIKPLTPETAADYFDFFDNRATSRTLLPSAHRLTYGSRARKPLADKCYPE
jgi:hypothetical protein